MSLLRDGLLMPMRNYMAYHELAKLTHSERKMWPLTTRPLQLLSLQVTRQHSSACNRRTRKKQTISFLELSLTSKNATGTVCDEL